MLSPSVPARVYYTQRKTVDILALDMVEVDVSDNGHLKIHPPSHEVICELPLHLCESAQSSAVQGWAESGQS